MFSCFALARNDSPISAALSEVIVDDMSLTQLTEVETDVKGKGQGKGRGISDEIKPTEKGEKRALPRWR